MNSKDFLKEGFVEDAHMMHQDHEVQMAREELYHAAEDAIALHRLLRNVSEQQGLEGWVSSKITLAADYLKTVREYLEYELMSQNSSNKVTVVGNVLPIAEDSQDKTVKIVKRRGKPIGEIGIDPEASPGNGPYYVKLYDGSVDLSGYDTAEEALAELKYLVKQSVAEGSTQKYEMMLRNGQVKRFVAKDDADAKRIAAGHGAKSVIRMKGNVPGDKIGEQGVAEGSEADAYGNTGEKHECGSCDGTGIVSYDELAKAAEYDDVCPECGGKGWVRDKESLKKKGVAEESSDNKYSNLSKRGVNRGINRAADDFDRMMDLDQAESPHYKTQHQQDTKQRLKTKPMAGPKGQLPKQGVVEGSEDNPVANAIYRRLMLQKPDLFTRYGLEYVAQAVEDVADFVGDVEEIGSSDVSGWVRQVEQNLKDKINQYDEPMKDIDRLAEMSAGSVATVVNPPAKNKSKVGTLFGGTYKQKKAKA